MLKLDFSLFEQTHTYLVMLYMAYNILIIQSQHYISIWANISCYLGSGFSGDKGRKRHPHINAAAKYTTDPVLE